MGARGRPKAELVLSTEERLTLERLANRRKSAQAMAMRARIVLTCAKGGTNREVAQQLGVSEAMVGKWRRRFVESRLDGLSDDPRPGAPRTITDDQVEAVIVKTLEEKGIGRPSTYASIINTIQDREYVTKISGRLPNFLHQFPAIGIIRKPVG